GDLVFSPDSKRLAYVAKDGDSQLVVVDETEGKQFDNISKIKGGHIIFDSNDSFHYLVAQGNVIWLVQEEIQSDSMEENCLPTKSKGKILVERDWAIEEMTDLAIEKCTAYYDEGIIRILGEVISRNRKPIQDYKELQVIVYDSGGDILARGYTNWALFGIRQSFEIELENRNVFSEPAKVKVFPSGG
ncbi:MAG: hypothetical protein V1866_05110, partial [archaeon]